MDKIDFERKKGVVLSRLGEIVRAAEEINEEMSGVPHTNEVANMSLNQTGEMYIVHSEVGGRKCFTAECHTNRDQKYTITVRRDY